MDGGKLDCHGLGGGGGLLIKEGCQGGRIIRLGLRLVRQAVEFELLGLQVRLRVSPELALRGAQQSLQFIDFGGVFREINLEEEVLEGLG